MIRYECECHNCSEVYVIAASEETNPQFCPFCGVPEEIEEYDEELSE